VSLLQLDVQVTLTRNQESTFDSSYTPSLFLDADLMERKKRVAKGEEIKHL
jgi:hypothetical protein